MHSSTFLINVIILNITRIGCFDSPRGPKQFGSRDGFSGARRGRATCHNRKMHDWHFLQAGIITQNQQNRRELTQQHEAAHAGMSSHASSHQNVRQHELLNSAYSSPAGVTCMATHAIMFTQRESGWQQNLHLW